MTYKMNLLPEELRKNKEINTKELVTRLVIFSAVGLILLGELLFASLLWSLKIKTSKLEAEIAQLQPAVLEVQNISKHNKEMTDKIQALETITANSSWADVIDDIASFMSDNIWLSRMYIDDKNALIIEGNADRLSALGNFMAGLRSIEEFKDVKLVSSASNLKGLKFTLSIGRGE